MPYYVLSDGTVTFKPEGETPPPGADGPFATRAEADAAGGASSPSDRKTQYVTLPDGSRALIDSATGETIKSYPAPQEAAAQPRNLGAGVFEDDQGYYVEKNVYVNDAQGARTEKRKTYITAAEAERLTNPQSQQTDANAAGNLNARYAELDLDRQRLQESIRQAREAEALAAQEYDFKVNQQTYNEAFNRREQAAQLARDAQAAWADMTGFQMQATQLTAQYQQVNAQMQQATDQFNASMQFNVQQGNQQAQAQKRSELAQNARDVASYSESPTDWGKLAAFELANRGGGFATDEQTDFTTDRSLQPLAGGLDVREQIGARPDNPYTFNPIAAPQVSLPDLSFLQPPGAEQGAPGAAAETPQDVRDRVVVEGGGAAGQFSDPNLTASQRAAIPDFVIAAGEKAGKKFESGGLSTGAYIAGDSSDGKENEELNIPLGGGQTLILSKRQMKPDAWKKLTKQVMQFQTGGLFDTTQARGFQTQAAQNARAGTPWQSGPLPGYTFASSPGLDQSVIDLIASLRGVEYGEDPGYFKRQSAQRRPAGMAPQVVGRTA